MKNYFLPAIKITLFTAILFGIVYPLFIVLAAKVIASDDGNGELIQVDGKAVGFKLIGQSFVSDKYFNSRPSAVNYNAAATGGSNKGPNNLDYLKQVEERINDFLLRNPGVKREDIPVDLITASGGGLDPHISPKAAMIQVARIAQARNMNASLVEALVKDYTEHPTLGIGTARVHVLRLNIALDALK